MNNYETFYELHHKKTPVVVGNAWNAKSAQLIEADGYDAVATSSGAISGSLGYADGEKIPFDEMLYIVKRIVASVNVPVSVDMERGYTNDVNVLTQYLQQLIDIGVVGINIEDNQGEESFLTKLNAIRNFLDTTRQSLFINARTDGFLQKMPSPLELTKRRAVLYQQAGADGLFVTGVSEPQVISEIVSATSLPVNVVGSPSLSIKTLTDCGVRRISMAVLLYKATYNQTARLVKEVNESQSFESLFK